MGKYDLFIGLGLVGGLALVLFTQQGKDLVIRPLAELVNKIPGLNIDSKAGAYAVDLRNLPYDANNYYLPPRDTSILP